MQLPLVAPAPVVKEHAQMFRELFENRCQFQHFENYLTGLMVLSNKSMANISRCLLESADKTNLSRFFSEAPWKQEKGTETRITYMLEQTAKYRRKAAQSCVSVDDTLCEHVGSMFEYVDRHYDHCEGRYPLGHNLVTTHFVSGAVRLPLDVRMYRRYEEQTRWEEFVRTHFPEREIPTETKARTRLHREVDETLLQDAEFAALHAQFRTKIALAIELIEQAGEHEVPFQTVLMDSWFLGAEVAEALAKLQKDWVSLLKKNRNLAVNSFTLRDEQGQKVVLAGPHIKVEDLVPLISRTAYTQVKIGERD
jgi:SRSO17 transposase